MLYDFEGDTENGELVIKEGDEVVILNQVSQTYPLNLTPPPYFQQMSLKSIFVHVNDVMTAYIISVSEVRMSVLQNLWNIHLISKPAN